MSDPLGFNDGYALRSSVATPDEVWAAPDLGSCGASGFAFGFTTSSSAKGWFQGFGSHDYGLKMNDVHGIQHEFA